MISDMSSLQEDIFEWFPLLVNIQVRKSLHYPMLLLNKTSDLRNVKGNTTPLAKHCPEINIFVWLKGFLNRTYSTL